MVKTGNTGCPPPGSEWRPSASLSGKGVTVLPPQPETKVYMIRQPTCNCKFGGYTWEVDREEAKEPCSRPHYWQEFPQEPPHPSRSQVRHSWGCSLGGRHGDSLTTLVWHRVGCAGSRPHYPLQDSPDWGLPARTPSHYPGPQPLCSLPPHPRSGHGKRGAWWAGAGPEEGALDSVTGRVGQAGPASEHRQLPARPLEGGAWVGFRVRRGCDCKARKLRESSD